jgi:exodeoxyribonuclease V alpha subunit
MRNFKDGYVVFDVRIPATEETAMKVVTCTGCIMIPPNNCLIEVTGEFKKTKYGEQLQDCVIKEVLNNKESMYFYLLRMPHVGKQAAEAVSNAFDNLDEILSFENPEQEIISRSGVTTKVAESIVSELKIHKGKTIIFNLLSRFGTAAYANTEKIYKDYGENSLNIFMSNPYEIGTKYGLPLSVCDCVANLTKTDLSDNPERIMAIACKMLDKASAKGDCCVEFAELIKNTRRRTGDSKLNNRNLSSSSILITQGILMENNKVITDMGCIYSKASYWQESRTAYAICKLLNSRKPCDCDPEKLAGYAENVCGVTYASQQREAFNAIKNGGISVLTGGPGTGKTTVIKGILAAYESLFPNNKIKLCAPTGRASQRMKEATGREACTVHRLLDYKPYGDTYTCKNESNPIEADFIIVDESSMISIDMAELLFNAISPGTMVLLVGDINQLPSVGPGNVLADIIASKILPVYALTQTHRQGAGSPIIENAKRIMNGEHQLMVNRDFRIVECSEDEIGAAVRSSFIQYHKPDDPFAVQVLSTTKKTAFSGCNVLNKMLQREVNPPQKNSIRYGDNVYSVGDKIMMLTNNYDIGYFNGDIGLVTSTEAEQITVNINGEYITIPNSLLGDMTLAYASTIHKSQGSEYDVCIIVLPPKPASMLERNMLYTAITRAKKRVILITSENTVYTCVNTIKSSQRVTKLKERLINRNQSISRKMLLEACHGN